jgi:UDP-glucose:(heptosyl)LPS alpha-1,3-glucosyltransferase
MPPQRNRRAAGCTDLRLAVVSPFVDRQHGTERALAELLERLAQNYRCEIHLYAQSVEDLQTNTPQPARSTEFGFIVWHKVLSVPGPHLVQFLAWMFLNGLLRKWHRVFRGASYDLVVSPGINCLRPNVVIVHALFHRLRELAREQNNGLAARASFFRRLHRRVYYGVLSTLERRIYGDPAIAIAAVSRRTAGLMKEYFHREDVRVIPNGVDTTHFSADARLARRADARKRRLIRDQDFVLLLIGNDWRVKGLLTVLEAMAALSVLPIRLMVVGDDDRESVGAHALQLGLQDHCRWEHTKTDVLDFYAAADVYVSPTREDSFGLPVAEAMACGLPVISSVFAGVADKIQDGIDGFLLQDPRDVHALSRLIQVLYSEPDLRSRMGAAAARTALEWTWDCNAEAVWKLLTDLSVGKHGFRV